MNKLTKAEYSGVGGKRQTQREGRWEEEDITGQVCSRRSRPARVWPVFEAELQETWS